MTDYSTKLRQYGQMIKPDLELIENQSRLSTTHQSAERTQLRNQLMKVAQAISANGLSDGYTWADLRGFIVMAIRSMLITVNQKYPDAKDTFDEELQIILIYMAAFKSPPFTLQRICELLLDPQRYYKSSKKLLFAVEKLVNVGDPDEK